MAVNRERKMVRREKGTLDLDLNSVSSVIEELQGYLAEYGDSARIECKQYPYEERDYWAVTVEEPETDEEMKHRIADEERWEAERAARDRAEFERLKAKFGA